MKFKEKDLKKFELHLKHEEKSRATCEKYVRDVRAFGRYVGSREITKEEAVGYKENLKESYAPASVNSMLVALNVFLGLLIDRTAALSSLSFSGKCFAAERKSSVLKNIKG